MFNIIKWLFGLKRSAATHHEPIEYTPLQNVPFIDCFHVDDIFGYLPCSSAREYPFKELSVIVKTSEPKLTMIDFMDIDTIGSSKSKENFPTYKTIKDFGEATQNREQWTIEECMKHIEDRIFHGNAHVTLYRWNNTLNISNSDGSHHLAVANYLLSIDTPYSGVTCFDMQYKESYVDTDAISDLTAKFHLFVLSKYTFNDVYRKYKKYSTDEMKNRYQSNETNNQNYLIAIEQNRKDLSNLIDDLRRKSEDDTSLCIDLNKYLAERANI